MYIVCTTMATTRVNFRLSEDLVERADLVAAITHQNRTEVVREALVTHLDQLEAEERFKESLVERYLEDDVSFDALRRVMDRRDAEAVRASKQLLDGGQAFVERLARDR